MAIQVSPGINVSEIDLTTVVPAVQTTTGAIAGIFSWGPVSVPTLVNSETNLVSVFGVPQNWNYETFFTAANFLSYGNSLYVVRGIDGAYNAVANTGSFSNVQVLNTQSYTNQTLSSNIAYVAKYPGSLGNSLTVSVCDSSNAYSSNLTLGFAQAVNNGITAFSVQSNTGSNVAVITVTSNGTANVANSTAHTLASVYLTLGDVLQLGNSTIGYQGVNITSVSISNTEANVGNTTALYSTISLGLSSPVFLPANVNQTLLQRQWQYYNTVSGAPGTSSYLSSLGSNVKDQLHAVVVDTNGSFTGSPGSVLEVFPFLSRVTNATSPQGSSIYYKTVLNNTSNYIWANADRAGAASANASSITSSTNYVPFTGNFVNGSDGNGEANCSLSAITGVGVGGYDLFANKENIDISLVLQGKARGVTVESASSPSSSGTTYSTLANYILSNITGYRKDCIAFISPALVDVINSNTTSSSTLSNVVAFQNNISLASSYGVMDSGYKYQYDKYSDTYRWVPLNGDVAGTCVRTDQNNDPWFSPAGFSRGRINNVVKLAWNPNKSQRDVLYSDYINPVVTFQGQGTILYGDKTLQDQPSAFDRINVRRLFIVIEKAISQAAQSSLFEFNDDYTRGNFVNLITPYLQQIQGRRGITAFKVVCDDTNNPPAVVNANQFVGDIYIQPARSINFIQLNFVAVNNGVSFSTIPGISS